MLTLAGLLAKRRASIAADKRFTDYDSLDTPQDERTLDRLFLRSLRLSWQYDRACGVYADQHDITYTRVLEMVEAAAEQEAR